TGKVVKSVRWMNKRKCVCLLPTHLCGQTEPVYGLLGADVELDPDVSETLFDISWQRGRYIVAMWYRDIAEHDYYGRCETGEQCDLNNSTGVLVMKGLKAEDEGRYLAEINGKTTDAQSAASCQLLSRTEPVSKPNVTTSCNETQCILTCVGEETEHTKYSWKENGKTTPGNTLTVQMSGEQSKSYTCVFSNPKSEEERKSFHRISHKFLLSCLKRCRNKREFLT
uniref:Ig-like domain-containing protein n=1 Tax=Scleropages formosus TaxID=113540 RepID=A0A8C9VSU3_SCLFO